MKKLKLIVIKNAAEASRGKYFSSRYVLSCPLNVLIPADHLQTSPFISSQNWPLVRKKVSVLKQFPFCCLIPRDIWLLLCENKQ